MNDWLTQLILAARKRGEDSGWVQILFFVIVSVFWAIGSIVKAKSSKTAPKGKEQTPRKPVRKPPESTMDLRMLKQLFGLPEEAESGSQSGSEKPKLRAARPQSIKPEVRPTGRRVVRPQPVVRKAPVEAPKIASRVRRVTAMPLAESAAPAEIQQTKYLSDILSDYEDPEKLRRAILHYEILGKPVSLREQERAF